ncbi:unnamed protein product [Caenorhabditis angaria]|uniref:Uncharacterized protein n=1 Tax=Caenorhabditis angaria TaxID=860376 RepID=A0A9P1IWD5_9PELO|nr:unnamed protein product [Caenorhabditis angaria]
MENRRSIRRSGNESGLDSPIRIRMERWRNPRGRHTHVDIDWKFIWELAPQMKNRWSIRRSGNESGLDSPIRIRMER